MKVDRKNLNIRHKEEGSNRSMRKRRTRRGGEKENNYEAALQILN